MKNIQLTKKTKINWLKILVTIGMLCLGFLMVLPLFWMISSSLKKPYEVFQFPIEWIPKVLNVNNYKEIWTNEVYPFSVFYLNSLKVAILSVLGFLFISSTAAYAFAKLNFKGKNLLFLIFLGTLMIPQHATLVPRFILFRWLGIYDTHWALILPSIINVLGIFLLRQFFIAIPIELSDAAKIDGANHFQIFWRIIIPLSKPALLSLTILSFTWSWNDYINPLVFLMSKEVYTLPIGLQAFIELERTQQNLVMAGATSAIIPLFIVFLFCQKYFIKGITSSGLKE